MPRAITLRFDCTASDLRRLARLSKDAPQARRLLALAAIYGGGKRTEVARLGNVTLQIVWRKARQYAAALRRRWVIASRRGCQKTACANAPSKRPARLRHHHGPAATP